MVPPDDDDRHVPRARFHALLARDYGPAENVEPLYLRVPDAERAVLVKLVARRLPPARPPRPRRDRDDRARLLPDAVVAIDVRRRAREAVVHLPRRVRRRDQASSIGYMIISRYVDAWHVMNIAVAPEHRRRGVGDRAARAPVRVDRRRGPRGYTLEVRVSNEGAIAPLRAARLQGTRDPARVLHRQPRGRADHVARPRSARASTRTSRRRR